MTLHFRYCTIIVLIFLYTFGSYEIIDYTTVHLNNNYATSTTGCSFGWAVLIKAIGNEDDITNVTSPIPNSWFDVASTDSRNYFFYYYADVLLNTKGNLTNVFEVNGVNVGGTIEYDCQAIPYPLVNLHRDTRFKRVSLNNYLIVLEFDLKKEILYPENLVFTYPYPLSLSCTNSKQGYQFFSVACTIIGFSDILTNPFPIQLTDLFGRTSSITVNFYDITYDYSPTVSVSAYFDPPDKPKFNKEFYYLVEFSNYNGPIFLRFLEDTNFDVYMYPIYGSYETNYTMINYIIPTQPIGISTWYLSGMLGQETGNMTYITSNDDPNVIPELNVTNISIQELDFEIEMVINNLPSFIIRQFFGEADTIYVFDYPFGVIGNNGSQLTLNLAFSLPRYNATLNLTASYQETVIPLFSDIITLNTTIDDSLPTIELIEYFPIGRGFIVRIHAMDIGSGVALITTWNYLYTLKSTNLVSGTLQNGTFEVYIVSSELYEYVYDIEIYDVAGNKRIYNDFYGDDFKPFPIFFSDISAVYTRTVDSIIFVRFAMNDVDLSILGCNNTLYFNFTNADRFADVVAEIQFSNTGSSSFYYGLWNVEEDMFSIDIPFVSRMFTETVAYNIKYRDNDYSSAYFPDDWQLRIYSEYADLMPPIITNIVASPPINSALGGNISWTFTIEDPYNGFKEGIITVGSLLDPYVIREFILSPNPNGNIYLDDYTIEIEIEAGCITDTYYIHTMTFFDTNYNENMVTLITTEPDYKINPLMKLINNESQLNQLSIQVDCFTPKVDFTPPTLTSVYISALQNSSHMDQPINLMSLDRVFYITFTVADTENPISNRHFPYCYMYLFFETSYSTVEILSRDDSLFTATYQCRFELDYGFGYPSTEALFSINGFADSKLNIGGASPTGLFDLGFNHSIPINYQKVPLIDSYQPLAQTESVLTIFGYGFGADNTTTQLQVRYLDNTNVSLYAQFQSDILMIISGIKVNQLQYTITVQNSVLSNSLLVIPTVPPDIKLPNITCYGTPLCGGPSNGECTVFGCICKYPWTSNDCMSQIVIIPPPKVNTSNPDIDNEFTTTLPNGDTVTLGAYIKIESLREMSFNDSVVKTFKFNSWIFTNKSSPLNDYLEYQYRTTVLSNGKTTKIKVTIQYYTQLKTIWFANEKVQMLPSTIKYRIEMSPYGFNDPLNYLQFLMSTTLDSTEDDVCSYQESGNVANSNIEYVRLQINETSLYCRYIKRGVVDNRIQWISNTIYPINSEQQTSNHLTRMVGVNIPYYIANALVDPDFTILWDLLPAYQKYGSVCDGGIADGLTKVQIIGIIIGCVAFAVGVGIGIFVYKILTDWEFKIKLRRKFEKKLYKL
ncbi:EGF-like domain-containing protein [Tieghemostelium lacteum]|uniref:EGF-like domain-containing protein n=1 Tax=Tieghemostelium lacteum TaxID=361077 RepID=A0A151Z7Y4_TIELA|nr:EGF-like domain-containing protein [Tieghemostelium lacteum]|eukprot:KYQ90061.1 EGF-like domain-containing protein [Tieghemostelium lacteum]